MSAFEEIEGLVVDIETGEIVNFPAGVGANEVAYLAGRRDAAMRQREKWDKLVGFYGELLGGYIDRTPEKKIKEGDYAVQWVEPKDREVIPTDMLVVWMDTQELPLPVKYNALAATVKTVDVPKLRELFKDDIAGIIERRPTKRYIKQDIIHKAAPSFHPVGDDLKPIPDNE